MVNVIKDLLLGVISKLDSGNSNLSEKEALEVVEILKKYSDKEIWMSKYQACQYLNISRATFDNYIRNGIIPKGTHIIGFKEKAWIKKDLDDVKDKIRNHSHK